MSHHLDGAISFVMSALPGFIIMIVEWRQEINLYRLTLLRRIIFKSKTS